jgi:hypothetical protein
MKVAAWTAGALALAWLATAGSLASPGGHPPLTYVVGMGVVLASFVIAPIGTGAALVDLWRARRQNTSTPRLVVAGLVLNLLFLAVAAGVWFWIRWEASRR